MKMQFWSAFFALAITITDVASDYVAVTWNPVNKQYMLYDHIVQDSVVAATFTDEIFKTGWSYLEIKSNESFPDHVQAYAAGLAEGHLTRGLLKNHWQNLVASYCDGEEAYCSRLQKFLEDNLVYMDKQIRSSRDYDPYFHQVALILEQLSGLEDGFHNVSGQPRTILDPMGMLLLNVMGDLEDLEAVLKRSVKRRPLGGGSCSGLIKVLPNNKDLYFSQDTWSSYNTMLRILKKYDFGFHNGISVGEPVVPGKIAAFSSQPGLVGSGDDFYVLSSGLATMETTIGNGNTSLYKYITPNGTVLEWIRSIVANRLAKNGIQWTSILSLLNSGTYNNQWMVIDYNKFQPGAPLQDNLLWVSEQLPGYMHNEDVTYVLRNQGYWPSYNVPYFKDIFNLSGGAESAAKHGDWFTYDKTPRALIFKRDNVKVHDIPSMIKLMRYNDYTNDPLSRCNCTPPYSAENAIAARCDLNPANGTYPFAALGHRSHGATDMKLTTASLFKKLQFVAIGGPTHDPLPVFQWSKSDYDKTVSHLGHPDIWDFKPIVHEWQQI